MGADDTPAFLELILAGAEDVPDDPGDPVTDLPSRPSEEDPSEDREAVRLIESDLPGANDTFLEMAAVVGDEAPMGILPPSGLAW